MKPTLNEIKLAKEVRDIKIKLQEIVALKSNPTINIDGAFMDKVLDQVSEQVNEKLSTLKQPEDGKDAQMTDSMLQEIADSVLARVVIPEPIKGDKGDSVKGESGKDAVITQDLIDSIVSDVLIEIEVPTAEEVAGALTANNEAVRDGLELLQDEERLDVSAIRGVEELIEKKAPKQVVHSGGGGGGVKKFTALTDTPTDYTGQALKGVRVNTGETALEYYTPTDENDAAVWGNITGTLSDQTDLQTALDGKVSKSGDSMTGDLTVGTDVFHVDTSNNRVGVGTDSPNATQHIYGAETILGVDGVALEVADSTGNALNNGGAMVFTANTTRVAGIKGIKEVETGSRGGLGFYTRDGSDLLERVRINKDGDVEVFNDLTVGSDSMYVDSANGRVGINELSPIAPLHVQQSTDNEGIRLYGYDDHSDKYLQIRINQYGSLQMAGTVSVFNFNTVDPKVADNKGMRFGNDNDFIVGYNSSDNSLKIGAGASVSAASGVTIETDGSIKTESGIKQVALSSDPSDPPSGETVQWVSDGTGSGDAGDVMIKINVGGTVKTTTLIDYSEI